MADDKTCPHCGKPVPPTALGGICPECMLKAGLAAQTEGPGGAGPQGTKVVLPPPSPAEIASLFPQLEILECLGRGGMGVVYKARQPRLNRLVALKILARDKEQDGQFAERFTREAQTLARLNHPNIVTVHDFGEAGGHCYLVMEFVDGLNLRQLLLAGKMRPDQALTIVPMICEALQYAHEQGIVHRDIKPENILLDKQGRVKIADFGIAKMLGVEAGHPALTGAKDVMGTPHYMAPEQVEKPLTVDHRADIYSLGVVFYEMLTGELPLGKFAPPSKKVQIDVRLDDVVLHTLEKEPARRYQQVNQLKTDVETIAGTVPPAAGFGTKGDPAPLLATLTGKTTSDKAILPALLLAFPFGVFGAHRFYVGKIGTAGLQLGAFLWCILLIIVCATNGPEPVCGILLGFSVFGCLVWAVIDWILILCKAFTDGQGKRITHWLHPQTGEIKAGDNPPSSPPSAPPSTPPPGGTSSASKPGPALPPAELVPGKTPGHVPGKIVAPAVGLMVGAVWKLLSALTALFFVSGYNRLVEPMLDNFGIGSLTGMAGDSLVLFKVIPRLLSVSLVLFKVIPGLLILFGAFQMLRLRSYAWAMAAAILSIVACSLIGFPIGIWALIILARQDVREAFARQSKPQPVLAGVWPWLIGIMVVIVAVMGAIVIVLMASYRFARHPIDRTHNVGVTDTGGSSTRQMAISAPAVPTENTAPAPVLPPVRIKAGSSSPITDSEGNMWLADQGFADGETTERSDHLAIANTKDPALYQSERYSMSSFSYPVPNGKYLVKLHFAETYEGITGPGERVFTFVVEGREFKDFDVWAKAGGAQRACVEMVNVEVTDGKLNVDFIPKKQNPQINGIEILPAPVTADAATASPSNNGNSNVTMNISSQNGRVVIETTNDRLSADTVQLGSQNGKLTVTARRLDYTTPAVTPMPSATPVPSVPPVSPIPPAAPAATPAPPKPATLSEPYTRRTKIIGDLVTTDEFQQDFSQTLPLTAKGRLSLDNVKGRIEIVGWDRNEAAIKALKHGKTMESVEAAKITVNSSPDEIVIHTEQPSSVTGFPWSWLWFKNSKRNDGTVDYAIQVPQNARLKNISSINGHIMIEDISGDIEASTVNGEMQVQGAAGSLKLSTVNGQVKAGLVSLGRGQSVSLDAVNGQIEATLPANADADVSASTVNGSIGSDFSALTVKKEFPVGSNLKGRLGNGGGRVNASTVNGSIRFRKGAGVPERNLTHHQNPPGPPPQKPPDQPKPVSAPATSSPRELAARYEAANAISAFDKRDAAFAALAKEAATAGDCALVKKILGQISMFTVRDDAAYESARILAGSGRRPEAIEVAKAITSFTKRDAALRELSE